MSDSVYIGLGSNLGDREQNLLSAVTALASIDAVAIIERSSLFDSAALGPPQPRFLNAVVRLECGLSPQRLLSICKRIETDLGRQPGRRHDARPIDLDILLWDTLVVADTNLQIPHLELHRRRFALEPLCEIAPGAIHPLLRRTALQLLQKLEPQDVSRHAAHLWTAS